MFSRCCCTENLPCPGRPSRRIYADPIKLGIRLGIRLGFVISSCNYKPGWHFVIGGLFVMRMMTKQCARAAGLFAFGMVLASCSNSQTAFFETRDAQLSQGYSWQKLDKCRPVRQGSQALPVTTNNGKRIVCYTLAAPEKPQASPNQSAAQSAAQSMASDDSVNSAPPVPVDSGTNAPGVSWEFSNF